MDEIIDYIIGFMLGSDVNESITRLVGYTSDKSKFSDYKVVIIPSGFFDDGIYGTKQSIPTFPLKNIEGIPFLFGGENIEYEGDTTVVHADLVASAYFLLTRYEEFVRPGIRDEHGRFPGKKSLPYLAEFIDRPVVDEYGIFIRKLLARRNVKTFNPNYSISKIYLTHDVDSPFYCRSWRNFFRVIRDTKNPFHAIFQKFKPLEEDKYYTFPFFLEQEDDIRSVAGEKCSICMFFKAGGKAKQDRPVYNLESKDIRELIKLCESYNTKIGLHSSYSSSNNLSMIEAEKSKLEQSLDIKVTDNRNHFLASRESQDMENLIKAGITDDYTMGYADVAGFRLGTSKPLRFINPATKHLTSLILHPLIIMDSTLKEKKYMDLTCKEAQDYCNILINNIKKVNGELTLLWHNTSFYQMDDLYLHGLYKNILMYIRK
jgi:hypothetical protein